MEQRESWGFKQDSLETLERAKKLSSMILTDVRASSLVPTEIWTLFVALLPYSDSLDAISDLSLVLPNIIKKIIVTKPHREDVAAARQVTIERLNQLLRRNLHNGILTERRRTAITIALRYANGDNE